MLQYAHVPPIALPYPSKKNWIGDSMNCIHGTECESCRIARTTPGIDWIKLLMYSERRGVRRMTVGWTFAKSSFDISDWIARRINKRLAGYEAMRNKCYEIIDLAMDRCEHPDADVPLVLLAISRKAEADHEANHR